MVIQFRIPTIAFSNVHHHAGPRLIQLRQSVRQSVWKRETEVGPQRIQYVQTPEEGRRAAASPPTSIGRNILSAAVPGWKTLGLRIFRAAFSGLMHKSQGGFKIGARTAVSARSWPQIKFARTRLSALLFLRFLNPSCIKARLCKLFLHLFPLFVSNSTELTH